MAVNDGADDSRKPRSAAEIVLHRMAQYDDMGRLGVFLHGNGALFECMLGLRHVFPAGDLRGRGPGRQEGPVCSCVQLHAAVATIGGDVRNRGVCARNCQRRRRISIKVFAERIGMIQAFRPHMLSKRLR